MALDRAAELRHLAATDVHIADTERRITEQAERLDHLRAQGHDTKQAEKILENLHGIREAAWSHRATIIDIIGKIDTGLI